MVMVVGKIAVSVVVRRSLSGRHRWGSVYAYILISIVEFYC